jgi:hypothetical protein
LISWVLAFESPDGLLKIGAMSWSERSRKKKQAELEQLESFMLLEVLSRVEETRLQMQHQTALAKQAILQSRSLVAEARKLRKARNP